MIEFTLELSDLVVMQLNTQCKYIPLKKLTASFLLEAKTLIEYNSYYLEENEDEGGN